jgi:hypothetical protein
MIFQICKASGMTPGRAPKVEAASAKEVLDRWGKSRGFADYTAAQAHGHAKQVFEGNDIISERPESLRRGCGQQKVML